MLKYFIKCLSFSELIYIRRCFWNEVWNTLSTDSTCCGLIPGCDISIIMDYSHISNVYIYTSWLQILFHDNTGKDNDVLLHLVNFACVGAHVAPCVRQVHICFHLSERCSKTAELTSATSALGGTSGTAGCCQAAITLMEMGWLQLSGPSLI